MLPVKIIYELQWNIETEEINNHIQDYHLWSTSIHKRIDVPTIEQNIYNKF